MAVIVTRPRAKSDLAEIWDYVANDIEARADAFIGKIDRKLQTLAARPLIGHLRDELAEGLRSFPIGRYIVFYLPQPDGIEVVRVLHAARDLDALFHSDDTDND
ncbi:MAG: type II toxin-antitoxin system RelE/ParE family toxin [Syntrophobacteraceae bacterium]|nr:type II toxin-antitoxin system RelE/ParE family toxin [Syntrophobacteraceae bacterium]